MKNRFCVGILSAALVLLWGCAGAEYHRRAVSGEGDRVSVGTVQRSIHVGMSGGEVIEVLGSPNIVTTDENRHEEWVYDKISTERVYSADSGGITSLIFGGATVGDGIAGAAGVPSYHGESGAASTTQRTFTVVIKFDAEKRVRDFAYHSSEF